MNIKVIVASMAVFSLAGCATVERGADSVRDFTKAHPVVTAVGVAIVAGSIAAAVEHRHDQSAEATLRRIRDEGLCDAHHPC